MISNIIISVFHHLHISHAAVFASEKEKPAGQGVLFFEAEKQADGAAGGEKNSCDAEYDKTAVHGCV